MSKPPLSAEAPVARVLHVLNYGWPHIDGYTVRSSGLITAQAQHLGLELDLGGEDGVLEEEQEES